MSEKSMPMRMKARTIRAINMLSGEIQLDTGENVSADDAVWQLIQEYRPDIAEKAEQAVEKTNGENNDKGDR